MKNYDKNRESSYLKNWDLNNLYEWVMSQKLALDNFKWAEGYFLNLMFNILKIYITFKTIYPFCLQKLKLKRLKEF